MCAAPSKPPRLVYVTPDQNNPTGAVLSEARHSREALTQALKAVKEILQAPPPIPWRTLCAPPDG